MKIAAYADLGGLGARQGPPTLYVWRLANSLPQLLPWLAVLALLALPSNRQGRAWLIWVPLAPFALLGAGLCEAADAAGGRELIYVAQVVCAAAFGVAAVWLLGAALARCRRAFGVVLLALAFAAVSLLAMVVSPVWEQLQDRSRMEPAMPLYLLVFWLASGLAYASALNLTGWMWRSRFGALGVSLRLLFWLWVMWLVAGGLLVGIVALGSGGGFEWLGFLVGTVAISLVTYVLVLPFLILSFASAFYRERLKHLLRLSTANSSLAVPATVPVADQKVRRKPLCNQLWMRISPFSWSRISRIRLGWFKTL